MEPLIAPNTMHRQVYRHYDVCIVFPYKVRALIRYGDTSERDNLSAPTDWEMRKMQKWEEERDRCLAALKGCGLVVSAFYSRDRDEVFVKVGVDGAKLMELAEQTRYPLQMREQYHGAYAEYRRDTPGSREAGYKDRKVLSSLYLHHPPPDSFEDETTIFRTVDRIRLIDYAIRAGDKGCAGLEIGELQYQGFIKMYFPLSEPHLLRKLSNPDDMFYIFIAPCWKMPPPGTCTCPPERRDPGDGDPLEQVRDYCGEKVAFYFQWQNHLNMWLVAGAVINAAVFVLDLCYGTPNNPVTAVYCALVVIWLCAFIADWKQKSNRLALRWGTLQRAEEVEFARPEFHGTKMVSSLTGRPEIQYPFKDRLFKMAQSYIVLTVVMAVMAFAIFFIFTVRHLFHKSHPVWGRVVFMLALALLVEVANMFFVKVAMKLNDRENHRTEREYDTNLLAKTFVFKSATNYGPLIYILFFKQNSHLFYFVQTDCMGNDCMVDMSCQLCMFYFVKLLFGNFVEWVWPVLITAYESWREHSDLRRLSAAGRQIQDMTSTERQAKKNKFDMFEQMDEIVGLYGLTVLFWTACPWAPFAMLGSNMIECWGDAQKMLRSCKRPFPTRAKDNEPWDTVFTLVTHIAVITNIATVVFTDDHINIPAFYLDDFFYLPFYSGWPLYKGSFTTWFDIPHFYMMELHPTKPEKILAFFIMQHMYFLLQIGIWIMYPPMAESVRNLVLKQSIIVKKAMDGTMDAAQFSTPLSSMTGLDMHDQVLDRDDEDDDDGIVTDACAIM
jgi:anoctamin-10/anoctamin-7